MPRVCSICTHSERSEIDRALLAGESFRNIAKRFGTSVAGLHRHKSDHLGERMAEVAERNAEADVRTALDVKAQLRMVNDEAHAVLQAAKAAKDGGLTLQAIDRITKQIELQARLIDLISDGATVNITINPQWVELRTVIVAALEHYPEARQAVAEAIQAAERGAINAHVA